jgi:hypothetical protein
MDNTFQIARNSNESFLFTLLFFGVWFIFPFACIFLFPLLLFKFTFDKRVENFMLLLIAISFGLVAYTTKSVGIRDSDISRYYLSYNYISNVHTFNDFILSYLLDGGNNFLFYLVTFLMTRVFPGNPQVMPLFWVSVTYFFSFLTIKECVRYFSLNRKIFILLIFFSCFGIITFYTTTEIVKQAASVSIFGYAILLKIQGKKRALFFTIISILVHFSSFILLPVYFFCNKPRILKFMPLIFFVSFILSFFNFNILLYSVLSLFLGKGSDLLMRVQFYEDVETWTISLRYYAVFFMYFFLLAVLYWDYLIESKTEAIERKQKIIIIHCLAFLILLINRSNVHNFLRYLMGYFTFYIMAVAQLFTIRIAKFDKIILLIIVLGFYLYSNFKMLSAQTIIGGDYGNSYMNNDLFRIATSNVVNFLDLRVKTKF